MLDFNVAGTGFKSDNVKVALEAFQSHPEGLQVKLEPEPTNAYDQYAVGVYLNAGDNGTFIHVGYVPRHFSREFSENFESIKDVKLTFIGKINGIRGTSITIEFNLES
jgi:hypothetical protein